MKQIGVKIYQTNKFKNDFEPVLIEPEQSNFKFSSTVIKFSSTIDKFSYANN